MSRGRGGTTEIGTKLSDFDVLEKIGSGAYGVVHKARIRANGRPCVIKRVAAQALSKRERVEAVSEVMLLRQINHRNIVKYYTSFTDDDNLYIVMELCQNGDLQKMLKRHKVQNKHVKESIVWRLFWEVSCAISHLHHKNIIHRDIKAVNVFLGQGNTAKLGDFGVSRVLANNASMASSRVGTPLYLAPEVVQKQEYDYKADVWALGCLVYELLALKPPFHGDNIFAVGQAIVNDKPPSLPASTNPLLVSLVLRMLDKRPQRRPSIQEVLHLFPMEHRPREGIPDVGVSDMAVPIAVSGRLRPTSAHARLGSRAIVPHGPAVGPTEGVEVKQYTGPQRLGLGLQQRSGQISDASVAALAAAAGGGDADIDVDADEGHLLLQRRRSSSSSSSGVRPSTAGVTRSGGGMPTGGVSMLRAVHCPAPAAAPAAGSLNGAPNKNSNDKQDGQNNNGNAGVHDVNNTGASARSGSSTAKPTAQQHVAHQQQRNVHKRPSTAPAHRPHTAPHYGHVYAPGETAVAGRVTVKAMRELEQQQLALAQQNLQRQTGNSDNSKTISANDGVAAVGKHASGVTGTSNASKADTATTTVSTVNVVPTTASTKARPPTHNGTYVATVSGSSLQQQQHGAHNVVSSLKPLSGLSKGLSMWSPRIDDCEVDGVVKNTSTASSSIQQGARGSSRVRPSTAPGHGHRRTEVVANVKDRVVAVGFGGTAADGPSLLADSPTSSPTPSPRHDVQARSNTNANGRRRPAHSRPVAPRASPAKAATPSKKAVASVEDDDDDDAGVIEDDSGSVDDALSDAAVGIVVDDGPSMLCTPRNVDDLPTPNAKQSAGFANALNRKLEEASSLNVVTAANKIVSKPSPKRLGPAIGAVVGSLRPAHVGKSRPQSAPVMPHRAGLGSNGMTSSTSVYRPSVSDLKAFAMNKKFERNMERRVASGGVNENTANGNVVQ